MAIVERAVVERLATFLGREVALEAKARELPAGKRRDELLVQLQNLRAIIKTLRHELQSLAPR